MSKQLFQFTKSNRLLHLDTTLQFGKHKGKNLQAVIEHDPEYVLWMVRTFKDAYFSSAVICALFSDVGQSENVEISYEDLNPSWGDID